MKKLEEIHTSILSRIRYFERKIKEYENKLEKSDKDNIEMKEIYIDRKRELEMVTAELKEIKEEIEDLKNQ